MNIEDKIADLELDIFSALTNDYYYELRMQYPDLTKSAKSDSLAKQKLATYRSQVEKEARLNELQHQVNVLNMRIKTLQGVDNGL